MHIIRLIRPELKGSGPLLFKIQYLQLEDKTYISFFNIKQREDIHADLGPKAFQK